jgi:uncharacterized damage-inducible protein DinB
MAFAIRYEQLLDYADHERRKWRGWIAEEPRRLALTVQPGGRFPTIGELLDHVFLIERRHLSRLEGATPPDATGIPSGDWQRLFEYADLVAADLRRYAADIDESEAGGTIAFTGADGKPWSMTRRHLMTHIVLHEIRHLAQIALSARVAGVGPPGEHDIAFFTEFA